MAKKGQIFQKYSATLKEEILNKYFLEHIPSTSLGRDYGISQYTIRTWVRKIKEGKDVLEDHRTGGSGRPKKEENDVNYKEKYEILKKYQAFLKAQREKR